MATPLNWYFPDQTGLELQGPYSTERLREMVKDKTVLFDHFVSCPEIESGRWFRVFACKEFQDLMASQPLCQAPKIFRAEKNTTPDPGGNTEPSTDIRCEIILHNEIRLQKGVVEKIHGREMAVSLQDSCCFEKGEELIFTFYGLKDIRGISGVCVITEFESGRLVLKLYLLRINPDARENLSKMLQPKTLQPGTTLPTA